MSTEVDVIVLGLGTIGEDLALQLLDTGLDVAGIEALTVAVHGRTPIENLRNSIFASPTFHGAVGEALGAYGAGTTTVLDPGYEPILAP